MKIISCISALSIIGLIFYRRLILEYVPREIEFNYSGGVLLMYFFTILLHFLLIYNLVYENHNKSTFISRGLTRIYHSNFYKKHEKKLIAFLVYLRNSFRDLYAFLASFKTFTNFLHNIGKIIIKAKNYTAYLLFTLNFLPRMIASFAFFIDVCVFNYFYYFYTFIGVLIIPFIFLLLRESLLIWANNCRVELRKFVSVEQNGEELKVQWLPNFDTPDEEGFATLEFYATYEDFCLTLLEMEQLLLLDAQKPFFRVSKCIISCLWILSFSFLIIFTF